MCIIHLWRYGHIFHEPIEETGVRVERGFEIHWTTYFIYLCIVASFLVGTQSINPPSMILCPFWEVHSHPSSPLLLVTSPLILLPPGLMKPVSPRRSTPKVSLLPKWNMRFTPKSLPIGRDSFPSCYGGLPLRDLIVCFHLMPANYAEPSKNQALWFLPFSQLVIGTTS